MRDIALDTETTGLSPANGDRIIEIGCVEIMNGRVTGNEFHSRFNPEGAPIHPKAFAVHGMAEEDLLDEPTFCQKHKELLQFIGSARLIIHNAKFDVPFLLSELQRCEADEDFDVLCTLVMARRVWPNMPNTLDSVSTRLKVDIERPIHGALIDARILADVWVKMRDLVWGN